jgi:hypothetical protein
MLFEKSDSGDLSTMRTPSILWACPVVEERSMADSLAKIRAKLQQKAALRDALNAEITRLEAAASVLSELEAEDEEKSAQLTTLPALAPSRSDVAVPVAVPAAVLTQNGVSERPQQDDLSRTTIVEAAVAVLKDKDKKTAHYRAIAEEAYQRGFRGRKGNLPTVITSFYQTLVRDAQQAGSQFRMTGQGYFALREAQDQEETPAVSLDRDAT